eukprot:gene12377-26033_t
MFDIVVDSFIFPRSLMPNNYKPSSITPTVVLSAQGDTQYIPPTLEDAKHLAFVLANITEFMDTKPELTIGFVSREMGWLYSRNITGLTQMLLNEFPTLRSDQGMQRAFMFLMDFLEVVAGETKTMIKKFQNTLRTILEAAKISETRVDEVLFDNRAEVCSPDFMVYLDSEIESLETEGPDNDPGVSSSRAMERMLVTIKLRVLDEAGRDLGIDVMELPRLAAENDPNLLKEKTLAHIEGHGPAGRELLLQTIRIMNVELAKRYQKVDATLQVRLKEIEQLIETAVQEDKLIASSSK